MISRNVLIKPIVLGPTYINDPKYMSHKYSPVSPIENIAA